MLANRFRDASDPLQLVLVRDMWLTGFDAPSLHTMYVDKPMRGHGLMQAIARVNRVFRDKPGGLVVDYLGLAHELKQALATYTESGGTGRTALDQSEAVAVMLEKHEICCALFHGFDRSAWIDGTPQERLGLQPAAQEHVLAQENGKDRCVQVVRELSRAWRRDAPRHRARAGRDCAQQRHHRLDPARERARQPASTGPSHPAQARLPAGQAGACNANGARTGRGAVGGMGCLKPGFDASVPRYRPTKRRASGGVWVHDVGICRHRSRVSIREDDQAGSTPDSRTWRSAPRMNRMSKAGTATTTAIAHIAASSPNPSLTSPNPIGPATEAMLTRV